MSNAPLITIEGDYGPAMQALSNDRWRDFVRIYCGQGKRNATHAYMLAYGYTDDKHKAGAQTNASRMLHDDRIQAAILECCQKALRTLTPLALEVFEEVASNRSAAQSDRLKAATAIADRAGLHARTEHHTTVSHIGQDPDQLKRISALAQLLNVDPSMLLGNRIEAPVIDITPQRVPVPEDFADEEY